MLILVCQAQPNVLLIQSITTGNEFQTRFSAFEHDGPIKGMSRPKLMRGLGIDGKLRKSILSGKAKVARMARVSVKQSLRGMAHGKALFEEPARPKRRGVGMPDDAAWAQADIARILFPISPIPRVEIDLFPNTVTVASKASVQRLMRALGPVKKTAKGRTAK